uniref:HEAT repeat domain-containing protein n=1 Tax=uncultured bacterium ws156A7 TaxID=1131828 RepID=I1X4R1_9BACT|nr:hypothetical protein ws156A7_0007 [uncultured bacterium ws156A7]
MAAVAPELSVRVTDGNLTVRSNGAPLYGVLWAISAQTEFTLNITGEVLSEGAPVVEEFADRPLADGVVYLLKQYLERPNYMLVTNDETGELETVHVFADAFGTPRISEPGSPEPSRDEGEMQPTDIGELSEDSDAMPDPLNQSIESAYAGTISHQLIDKLQVLGHSHDPHSLEVVQPALHSDQPAVRIAALEAISRVHAESPDVLADIRSLATGDPEPAVRQAAVMTLARHDDSSMETRMLLEALVDREDIPNLDYFRQALDRMDEEAAARSLADTQSQLQ